MYDIDHTLLQVEPQSQFDFESNFYYNYDTEYYGYDITDVAVFDETEEMVLPTAYK